MINCLMFHDIKYNINMNMFNRYCNASLILQTTAI